MGRRNITVSVSEGSELDQRWDEFAERYDTKSEAGRAALRAGIDALDEEADEEGDDGGMSLLQALASKSILSFALALQAFALVLWGIALTIDGLTALSLALVGAGTVAELLAGGVGTLFVVARLLLAPSLTELVDLPAIKPGGAHE